MRVHVTVRGKKTTVSIDDVLADYFGAWIVKDQEPLHKRARLQALQVKSEVRGIVARITDGVPEKNISQYVQGVIIACIAEPGLAEIVKKRGPRYVKPKFDINNLFQDEEEKQAYIKKIGLA